MTKLDQDVSFRLITIQLIDCFHLFSAHTCKERERERPETSNTFLKRAHITELIKHKTV